MFIQNIRNGISRLISVISRLMMRFAARFVKVIHYFAKHRDNLGYYAALSLVLIALGSAAYSYRSRDSLPEKTGEAEAPGRAVVVQTQPDPTLPPVEAAVQYILPVQGEIIGIYSDEELVWSDTFQMWQTHPAIDISAALGEEVVAAADGTVLEVYSDALYGNTIVIDHGDGEIIRYASLNTLQLVKPGQTVVQGETISAAGTCAAEGDLGAHVHLEYYSNQSPSDFSLCFEE